MRTSFYHSQKLNALKSAIGDGAGIFEHYGLDVRKRTKQKINLCEGSVSMYFYKGIYKASIFSKGILAMNAYSFVAFINGWDKQTDYKQIYNEIAKILNLDLPFAYQNYIPTRIIKSASSVINSIHSNSVHSANHVKIAKKAKKAYKFETNLLVLKDRFSAEGLNYFLNKHGVNSSKKDEITHFLAILNEEKIFEVDYTITKFEFGNEIKSYKKLCFVLQTSQGIYKVISPKFALGKEYHLGVPAKRATFYTTENFVKTEKPENYAFGLGLNNKFDIFKPIIWCSGESDYLTLRYFGFQAICLDGEGKYFTKEQEEIMRQNGYGIENLTILFDFDAEGLKLAKKASAKYQIPYIDYHSKLAFTQSGSVFFESKGIKDATDFVSKGFKDNFLFLLENKDCLNFDFRFVEENQIIEYDCQFPEGKNHLSDDSFFCEKMFETVENNEITVLDCTAGLGKTHYVIKDLAKRIEVAQKGKILFFAPNIDLALQCASIYDIKAIYGDQKIETIGNVANLDYITVATYDQAPNILSKETPYLIVADEAHSIPNDSNFRGIMNKMSNIIIKGKIKTLLVSATHNQDFLEECKKSKKTFKHIKIKNEVNELEVNPMEFLLAKNAKNEALTLAKQIIAEGKIPFIYMNSKESLMAFKKYFAKENIKADIFASEKYKTVKNDLQKSIIETGFIPQQTEVVLCTKSIIQGINILNSAEDGITNREVVLIALEDDLHPLPICDVIQFGARIRRQKKTKLYLFQKQRNNFNELDRLTAHNKFENSITIAKESVEKANYFGLGNDKQTVKTCFNQSKMPELYFPYMTEIDFEFVLSTNYIAFVKTKLFEKYLTGEEYLSELSKQGRGIFVAKCSLSTHLKEITAVEVGKQGTEIESLANIANSIKEIKEAKKENLKYAFKIANENIGTFATIISEFSKDHKLIKFFKPFADQSRSEDIPLAEVILLAERIMKINELFDFQTLKETLELIKDCYHSDQEFSKLYKIEKLGAYFFHSKSISSLSKQSLKYKRFFHLKNLSEIIKDGLKNGLDVKMATTDLQKQICEKIWLYYSNANQEDRRDMQSDLMRELNFENLGREFLKVWNFVCLLFEIETKRVKRNDKKITVITDFKFRFE